MKNEEFDDKNIKKEAVDKAYIILIDDIDFFYDSIDDIPKGWFLNKDGTDYIFDKNHRIYRF